MIKSTFKILIAVALIVYVLNRFNLSQTFEILNNPFYIILICIGWFLNLSLTAIRYKYVSKVFELDISIFNTIKISFISQFIGNLLFGVIGADVYKMIFLKKTYQNYSTSTLIITVIIDRLLGLMALFEFCLFSSGYFLTLPQSNLTKLQFEITQKIFVLSLIVTILSFLIFPSLKFALKTKLIKKYNVLYMNLNLNNLFKIYLVNFVAVGILLFSLAVVGSLDNQSNLNLRNMISQILIIPISLIVSMIPLTPMGIGISQLSMGSGYKLFGLDGDLGVAISTASQLGLILNSIICGMPLFFWDKRNTNHPLKK